MHDLRPTLWRTCRVIACETRLKLLWVLFDEEELCVADLARRTGMGAAQASVQLRALNARGLIKSRRVKMRVLYSPEANEAVDDAVKLLEGLRQAHARHMAFKTVIRQATAFTHYRRLELVRILREEAKDWEGLVHSTGMPTSSLFLHLGKLTARGFVVKSGEKYKLARPANLFGQMLLQIVKS